MSKLKMVTPIQDQDCFICHGNRNSFYEVEAGRFVCQKKCYKFFTQSPRYEALINDADAQRFLNNREVIVTCGDRHEVLTFGHIEAAVNKMVPHWYLNDTIYQITQTHCVVYTGINDPQRRTKVVEEIRMYLLRCWWKRLREMDKNYENTIFTVNEERVKEHIKYYEEKADTLKTLF